jgi:hypothetical protein
MVALPVPSARQPRRDAGVTRRQARADRQMLAGCDPRDWQTRNGVNGRPLYSGIVGFVDWETFDRFCNLVLGLNRAEFPNMLDDEGEP